MSLAIPKIDPIYTTNFLIAVQQGLVPGHSIISKFAENPDIDSGSPADVWDFPDALLYTFSSTAAIDSISSDNAGDTIEIVVQGLDADFKEVTQAVMINGQTRVALPTPLIRCHRAFNGNGVDMLGNVYVYENTPISGGVPIDSTKVRAYISTFEQQTLMGVYTVPAGKTAFFLGFMASLSKPVASATAIITGSSRPFERVFRTQLRFAISSVGSSSVEVPSNAFSLFPAKTDFVAHANASANNTGVSITFDFLLVEDAI